MPTARQLTLIKLGLLCFRIFVDVMATGNSLQDLAFLLPNFAQPLARNKFHTAISTT